MVITQKPGGDYMKILVCVKQVADSESVFEIAPEQDRLAFRSNTVWRLNRYDEYALEEALLLAEKYPDTEIDVISIGPGRAVQAVSRAISLGADNGYHILFEHEGNIPPHIKGRIISGFASSKEYDLIFAGVMSEDYGNSSTGPMAAALLNIPFATHAMKLEPDSSAGTVKVETEIDSRTRYHTVLRLPALITFQSGINRPRYPSLTNVLRSKSYKPSVINAADLADINAIQNNIRLAKPETGRKGELHEGGSAELAEKALRYFRSKSLL